MVTVEDDITLTCPCCNSKLSIDDCGDAVLVEQGELPTGHHRGLGGLTVVEAEPEWKSSAYFFNQAASNQDTKLKPLTAFTALAESLEPEAEPEPIEPNPEVLAASAKDLRDKGIL